MTEEEKEAIKTTKAILKEWQKIVDIEDPEERDIEMSCYIEEMPFWEMKTLLKIIKKQQKEMASMQMNYEAKIDKMEYEMGYDYISKDKIRDKIKELDDLNSKFSQRVINSNEPYFTEMIQNILKEILEED